MSNSHKLHAVPVIISLLLPIVLLYACVSFANPKSERQGEIQYADRPNADYQLGLSGIYALDKEMVFLFGGAIEASDEWWGPYYSVLLRSDDGGKHWNEVMQPVVGSDASEIGFLENGNGWALVVWITEGAGPASLYHTTDYGNNWELLSNIPFFGDHSPTGNVQFFDSRHVQVREVDETQDRGCCILESLDGGVTWHVGECSGSSDSVAWEECFPNQRRPAEVVAQDGSQWRFEVQTDVEKTAVSRRLPTEESWSIVSLIPVSFSFTDD